jgi:hypothetical protein
VRDRETITKEETTMEIGETIRVGRDEFIVEEFRDMGDGHLDVVMTKAHMLGVKFYGILKEAK